MQDGDEARSANDSGAAGADRMAAITGILALQPFRSGGLEIDLRPSGEPLPGEWRALANVVPFDTGALVYCDDPRGSPGCEIHLRSGDKLSVGQAERMFGPDDLKVDRLARAPLRLFRQRRWLEGQVEAGTVYYAHPHHAFCRSLVEVPGILLRYGAARNLRHRIDALEAPERAATAATFVQLEAHINETGARLAEELPTANDDIPALLKWALWSVADPAAAFGHEVGVLERRIVARERKREADTRRERETRGGRTSGEQNRQRADQAWRHRGLEIAVEYRARESDIGQDTLAERVREDLLDCGHLGVPRHDRVKEMIKLWERDGLLARGSRNPTRGGR